MAVHGRLRRAGGARGVEPEGHRVPAHRLGRQRGAGAPATQGVEIEHAWSPKRLRVHARGGQHRAIGHHRLRPAIGQDGPELRRRRAACSAGPPPRPASARRRRSRPRRGRRGAGSPPAARARHPARPQPVRRPARSGPELGVGDGAGRGDQRRPRAVALLDRRVDEERPPHCPSRRRSGSGRLACSRGMPNPAALDAVEDAVELVAPVGVRGPHVVERCRSPRCTRARTRPARPSASHPRGSGGGPRRDRSRSPRRPPRRAAADPGRAGTRRQEEPRGEADRARGRRDEVREIAKRRQVEVPALARRAARGSGASSPTSAWRSRSTRSRHRRIARVDRPAVARRSRRAAPSPRPARARR